MTETYDFRFVAHLLAASDNRQGLKEVLPTLVTGALQEPRYHPQE